MTVRGLHHVNIRAGADEIARLREFYCDVIGLSEGWRPPLASQGQWLYGGGQPILHLVQDADDSAQPRTSFGRSPLDHFALRCVDLELTLSRLRSRGIVHTLSQVPVTGDMQIFLRDPLGIGVELNFPARP